MPMKGGYGYKGKAVAGKAAMKYPKHSGGGGASPTGDFKHTAQEGGVGPDFGGMADWGENARVRTTSLPAGGCPAKARTPKYKKRLRSYA